MSRHYSDESRASEPYALPDVEVWQDRVYMSDCCEIAHCGEHATATDEQPCASCGGVTTFTATPRIGWFWWTCFPGCLPDSEPVGPFATEQDAIDDAQKSASE